MSTLQITLFSIWLAVIALLMFFPGGRRALVKPYWSPIEIVALVAIYTFSEKIFPPWSTATGLEIFLEITSCVCFVVAACFGIVLQGRYWNQPQPREDSK